MNRAIVGLLILFIALLAGIACDSRPKYIISGPGEVVHDTLVVCNHCCPRHCRH